MKTLIEKRVLVKKMTLIKREYLEEGFSERHDSDWTDNFDFKNDCEWKEKQQRNTLFEKKTMIEHEDLYKFERGL